MIKKNISVTELFASFKNEVSFAIRDSFEELNINKFLLGGIIKLASPHGSKLENSISIAIGKYYFYNKNPQPVSEQVRLITDQIINTLKNVKKYKYLEEVYSVIITALFFSKDFEKTQQYMNRYYQDMEGKSYNNTINSKIASKRSSVEMEISFKNLDKSKFPELPKTQADYRFDKAFDDCMKESKIFSALILKKMILKVADFE